jgi:NADPH-dependent 2,4-dienoyl-CoA reductase/sulfur reductase-like enzyme
MVGSDYLIVGGGMTAAAAVQGIREIDPDGAITLVSAEPDPPYKRPPLSKKLWTGGSEDSIWSELDRDGVELRLGQHIARIDPASGHAVDDTGAIHHYRKLLLATGSSPRMLTGTGDRIVHFRTLRDYRRLRDLAASGDHFAVIGGGFIGSELAAALATIGKRVTMIFPTGAISDRIFPRDMAYWLNGYFAARGIEVLAGTTVTELADRGDAVTVRVSTEGGGERELRVDGAVVGIGTTPNVDLARDAGLPVGDGIVVDALLNAGHPDIFAAGDDAYAYLPALGVRRRIEHEDNAKTMGRAAGRAMAGEAAPWEHLPFFYSDLFDLGYEAVGDLDPALDIVTDWREQYHEGVVYYLRDDRVRGVLLWNVWDQVDAARGLIRAGEPVDRSDVASWLLANPLTPGA